MAASTSDRQTCFCYRPPVFVFQMGAFSGYFFAHLSFHTNVLAGFGNAEAGWRTPARAHVSDRNRKCRRNPNITRGAPGTEKLVESIPCAGSAAPQKPQGALSSAFGA